MTLSGARVGHTERQYHPDASCEGLKNSRCYAARRRRFCFWFKRWAMVMRLLVSRAAPTNTSKRSRPSARHRFMPRPRKSTEMRPSMPARKRCPFLNSGLFSKASRSAVLFPPRWGIQTSFTSWQAWLCSSLKNPRSELYKAGAKPKSPDDA
jgi:hypothetical protein